MTKLRTTVLRAKLQGCKDSRYQLVRFAAENIEADYFWFIDDDDWLFPNEAERLSLALNSAPTDSIVFVDSQHYHESPIQSDINGQAISYRSQEARYFPARLFMGTLSGHNHTPFCGALFARNVLLAIPHKAYETVTYYEDFMTTLYALLSGNCFPIVVDKLFAGISLRESGNTVTEKDRTKWNQSMSELVAILVSAKSGSAQLLSLQTLPGNFVASTAEVAELRTQLNNIVQTNSWKVTRPLRALARVLRGDWSPTELTVSTPFSTLRAINSAIVMIPVVSG